MIYLLLLGILFFLVVVLVNSGLIWLCLKMFGVKETTFWKAVKIFLILYLINLLLMCLFYFIDQLVLWGLLSMIVYILGFVLLLQKYFGLKWLKSLLIYLVYLVMQAGVGVVVVLLLVMPLKMYVFGLYILDGNSMSPTMENGDMFVVDKWSQDYQNGDIVVYIDVEKQTAIVQRIVGVPGELVEIKDGKVFINGLELKEDYIEKATLGETQLTLGEDQFYMLGDNRTDSRDSRIVGVIDRDQIVGEYFFTYFPWD